MACKNFTPTLKTVYEQMLIIFQKGKWKMVLITVKKIQSESFSNPHCYMTKRKIQ